MRVFLFLFALLAIAYLGISYYMGGLIVGYQNGHVIVYRNICADMYCTWTKKYAGKINEQTCIALGGKPSYITMAGVVVHGYNGCDPK